MLGTTLGRMCRTSTWKREAPSVRAASRNSRRRSDSVSERTTRATIAHDVNPSTATSLSMPGPNSEITTIARKNRGRTWNASVTRMSTSSTVPPAEPDTAPITNPITATIPATPSPMPIDARAPCRTPLNTSRPRSSVPMRCSAEGAASARPIGENGS